MSVNSNREALRRLIRKLPTPPEVLNLLDKLTKSSDMHAAIMATAVLEAYLEELIVQKAYKPSNALIGQIFQNSGPLSDFHSKILIAEAFGIITPAMAEHLHAIKVIRNVFAHAKVEIDFEHELISRELKSLGGLVAMNEVLGAPSSGAKKIPPITLSNKSSFLIMARIFLSMLDKLKKHPVNLGPALEIARKEGWWPSSDK